VVGGISMFKVHEKLETEIEVAGVVYEVNLAFDNVMKLLDLIKQPHFSDGEKVFYGIYLLLGVELDIEMEQQLIVFESLIENFVHAEDERDVNVDLEGNIMPVADKKQTYDLTHDAGYIYTSFRQAYDINLFKEHGRLDWREFKILLRDLPDDTKFKQVIDIRTRPYPKGKGMSEERKQLKDLKRNFALPGSVEDED